MLLKQGCGATRRSDQIRSEHSLAALPCAFMGSCAWGSWWRGDLSERWHRGHHGAVVCSVPWARCRQDLCLGCLPLLFVQPPAHPGPTAVVGSQGWSLLWITGLIPQCLPSAELKGQGLRATSVVGSSTAGWGRAVLEGAAPFSIPSLPWGPGGSVCVPTRVRSVLGCSDVLSRCQPSAYSVLYVWRLQTLQLEYFHSSFQNKMTA